MKHPVKTGAGILLVVAVVMLPGVITTVLGFSSLSVVGAMAALPAVVATIMMNTRFALTMAAGTAISMSLMVFVAHDPIAAGICFAAISFAAGMTAVRGVAFIAVMIPIETAFIFVAPPEVFPNQVGNAGFVFVVALISGVWAALAGGVIARRVPKHTFEPVHRDRAIAYATMIAVLTGITAWAVARYNWGHSGAWVLLTVLVVLQPYLQDAFKKTLHRSFGTVLGFVAAYIFGLIIPIPALLYVVGTACLAAAMIAMVDRKLPYWLYVSFLTPAIVLLEGANTSVTATAIDRLLATLIGTGAALAAIALVIPLYRRTARTHHLDHF